MNRLFSIKNILLLVFLFGSCSLFAQQAVENKAQTIEEMPLIFSVSPQHILVGGFNFGIEKHLGSPKKWIGIYPQIYLKKNQGIFNDLGSNDYNFNDMKGAGIELLYRYYLGDKINFNFTADGFRASVGLAVNYQFFQLSYDGDIWRDYDNLLYLERGEIDVNVHRVTPAFYIFLQNNFSREMILDMYIGMGLRLSQQDYDKTNTSFYTEIDENMYDYAYSGAIFLAGIKFNFILD